MAFRADSDGLLVRCAKTGILQIVAVRDAVLVRLLRRVTVEGLARGSDAFLFPLAYSQLTTACHEGLSYLLLSDSGFTPHFLRHGGAT